jgi:superfamily II DNA or RNA helicase
MILRDYQLEILKQLNERTDNCCVQLETGAGKTPIIAEFAKRQKGDVVIVAHRNVLIEQISANVQQNAQNSQQTEKIHTNTNRVPLTYELFKRDALIFKKLQSNSLSIIEKGKPILKVVVQMED